MVGPVAPRSSYLERGEVDLRSSLSLPLSTWNAIAFRAYVLALYLERGGWNAPRVDSAKRKKKKRRKCVAYGNDVIFLGLLRGNERALAAVHDVTKSPRALSQATWPCNFLRVFRAVCRAR